MGYSPRGLKELDTTVRLNFQKHMRFPGVSVVKNPPANAGEAHSIPGRGRSPGEGNGNPLQYSCLGNPTDRGAWWATVYGAIKSWTQLKQMNTVAWHR